MDMEGSRILYDLSPICEFLPFNISFAGFMMITSAICFVVAPKALDECELSINSSSSTPV